MTRNRFPHDLVMQRAYDVLDKYQISRKFFIKTDQSNCESIATTQKAYPIEPSASTAIRPEKKNRPNAPNKIVEKSDILMLEAVSKSNATVIANDGPMIGTKN